VTSKRSIAAELTAEIHTGPLQGVQGIILETTAHGQVLFQLGNLPGIAVLLSSAMVSELSACR
jgi:hypothetical protein